MGFRGVRSRAARLRREIEDKVFSESLPGLRVILYDDPDYKDVCFDGDHTDCGYSVVRQPDHLPTDEGLVPHLSELPQGGMNIAYWSTFDDVMECEASVRRLPGLKDAKTD